MWRSPDTSRRLDVAVVTDAGPDPDDVKALLVLAMAHRSGRIRLAAVVANGGGQPGLRAQLMRLLLNRIGELGVPVGVGSLGVALAEQPHECALRGFAAVDPSRLLDGPALLLRTRVRAAPRSVAVLLISGLRDFADVVLAQPGLVQRKVRAVAIQGGLVPDAAAPFGFAPDTSQNNAFDPAAAAAVVYNFCFAQGIRMSFVSRDAVPVRCTRAARSCARARGACLPPSHPAAPPCGHPRAPLSCVYACARRCTLAWARSCCRCSSRALSPRAPSRRCCATSPQFLGLAGLWK